MTTTTTSTKTSRRRPAADINVVGSLAMLGVGFAIGIGGVLHYVSEARERTATEQEVTSQLEAGGLDVLDVIYSKDNVPTWVAKAPNGDVVNATYPGGQVVINDKTASATLEDYLGAL